MNGHWTVEEGVPVWVDGTGEYSRSWSITRDALAYQLWTGMLDDPATAVGALAADIQTLDTARKLAARLDQRIDDQGHPVDREATVVALLDLLREEEA